MYLQKVLICNYLRAHPKYTVTKREKSLYFSN
jgi:hypothetical protein